MSKFRAYVVSAVLATSLLGGASTATGASVADGELEIQRPVASRTVWCC